MLRTNYDDINEHKEIRDLIYIIYKMMIVEKFEKQKKFPQINLCLSYYISMHLPLNAYVIVISLNKPVKR